MTVVQLYNLVNTITDEITGGSAVVNEDLSNVVDIGRAIFDATNVDNYVKTLVDHIGKVIFVNRAYSGSAPSVLMDGWEFGSVLEKIQVEMPDAVENDDWDLTDGASYDPNVFHKPVVSAKFFNSKVTFEIDVSFTEMQVRESFSSVAQLNGFVSMIYNSVDKSMTVKVDGLIARTINNFVGQTLNDEYPDPLNTTPYANATGVRAINLLKMYNDQFSASLTVSNCLTNADFIRYATMQIGLVTDRFKKMSKVYNIGSKERFTPEDMQHMILLAEFDKASRAYLMSDTFHNDFVALPAHEVVPYWQGSGTSYAFTSTSAIDIKILDPTDNTSTITVSCDGIIGCLFDRDALGVTNYERRVTSHFNGKASFYNNFYKMDSAYFNDFNENFVVFFVA